MDKPKQSTSSQLGRIRTIRDLEQYMAAHELSPEAMACKIPLSNMTIRRMLRRKASEKISEKYWSMFDQLLADSSDISDPHSVQISTHLFSDFESLTQDLERSGREHQDSDQLEVDVCSKMERDNIGKGLKTSIKALLGAANQSNSTLRSRSIAVGALLYFLNPVDLIPDALVGVGYLDDVAVASVAISAIANKSKATHKDKKKFAK